MKYILVVQLVKNGNFVELHRRKTNFDLTLEEMQSIVGGRIEVAHPDELPSWARVVCDDEGKIKRKQDLRWYCHFGGRPDEICGTFFVCAQAIVDGEQVLVPMTAEQTKEVEKCMFKGFYHEVTMETPAAGRGAEPTTGGKAAQGAPEPTEKPKSVMRQLEDVAAEICDKICKWMVTAQDEDDLARHCDGCPLYRLV